MKNEAVFLEYSGEMTIDPKMVPDFYRLYQQSVLLALKEQGILNDIQFRYALDILSHQD